MPRTIGLNRRCEQIEATHTKPLSEPVSLDRFALLARTTRESLRRAAVSGGARLQRLGQVLYQVGDILQSDRKPE